MDLIVWHKTDGAFCGFQLCYDKPGKEHAFTWTLASDFTHRTVDAGDAHPLSNCTPILVPDGLVPLNKIKREFLARSSEIDSQIRKFVVLKLEEFGSRQFT